MTVGTRRTRGPSASPRGPRASCVPPHRHRVRRHARQTENRTRMAIIWSLWLNVHSRRSATCSRMHCSSAVPSRYGTAHYDSLLSRRDDLPHSRRYRNTNLRYRFCAQRCDELPQSYSVDENGAITRCPADSVATICRTGERISLRRSAAVIRAPSCEAASSRSARWTTTLRKLRFDLWSIERDAVRTPRHRCCVRAEAMSGKVAVAFADSATHWKNCAQERLSEPGPARFCRSYASRCCRTSQISEESPKGGIGLGADARLQTRGLSHCAKVRAWSLAAPGVLVRRRADRDAARVRTADGGRGSLRSRAFDWR